jgi:hypothetical protein
MKAIAGPVLEARVCSAHWMRASLVLWPPKPQDAEQEGEGRP